MTIVFCNALPFFAGSAEGCTTSSWPPDPPLLVSFRQVRLFVLVYNPVLYISLSQTRVLAWLWQSRAQCGPVDATLSRCTWYYSQAAVNLELSGCHMLCTCLTDNAFSFLMCLSLNCTLTVIAVCLAFLLSLCSCITMSRQRRLSSACVGNVVSLV